MNTNGLTLEQIDYEAPYTLESVKQTRPVLYVDGDGYGCILGPDPVTGIYGHGKTPAEAMVNFDRQYQDRLKHPITDDPVADFILHRHI